MKRPICVHCKQAYCGQRSTETETVRWNDGEEMPPYQGNGILLRETYHGKSASRESVRMLRQVNAVNADQVEAEVAAIPERQYHTAFRTVWDGESWAASAYPFCTLRCALDYARRAYEARPGDLHYTRKRNQNEGR